jgi:organic hydroperoxide reductase OsmC/OhrA
MLWYLHLCAVNGVVVVDYTDSAEGEMSENADGSGEFVSVILKPRVTVSKPSMFDKAQSLHAEAHRLCFIARSVIFPVLHRPEVSCYEEA